MNIEWEQNFIKADSAIVSDSMDVYLECLRKDPLLPTRIFCGKSLLHAALPGSRVTFIKNLFANGADPNLGDPAPVTLICPGDKAREIFKLFKEQEIFDQSKISENSFLYRFERDLPMR